MSDDNIGWRRRHSHPNLKTSIGLRSPLVRIEGFVLRSEVALTMLRWHLVGSMWNVYDKLSLTFNNLLVKILGMPRFWALILWTPNQWAFKTWRVLYLVLFPLGYLTFELGHFTLAQTIEGLKIGQPLRSLSFRWKNVNCSKYQTPNNCNFGF